MTPMLVAENVQFGYGPQSVLCGVTLAVHPGEIVALAGPNGAGKTTLVKVLAGILAPSLGRVLTFIDHPRAIAYLAQSEELPPEWSVREVVELGRMPHVGRWRGLTATDDRSVRSAMERTEVLHLSGRLVAALSGGERQRVAIARALAQEPKVLLLDEPSVHLDPRHQVALLATLRAEAARGVGIVVVMHDLGFAAQADRCVLLSNGMVRADGPPAEVLCADVLRDVYEIDVEVLRTADDRIVIAPMPQMTADASRPIRIENKPWNHITSS